MGMVGKSGNASVSLFSAETEQMGRESIPEEVLKALLDKDIRKMAYNAAFERTVLSRYLGRELNPAQWYCTMVQGYTLGMPGGLDMVGKVIGLSEDKQKLAIGKRLIQYFCKPCKPTRANGQRTRNLPTDDPQKWQLFKEYCIRDVEAERAIRDRLKDFEPGPRERELWCLDQKINDAGVLLDMSIVNNALAFDERLREEWLDEAHRISGLSNPNSNQQILDWVNAKLGTNLVSLDKEARAGLLDRQDLPDEVRKVVILKTGWQRPAYGNTRQCVMQGAGTAGFTVCSSSMELTGQADGQAGLFSYIICHRIIWRTWTETGTWLDRECTRL